MFTYDHHTLRLLGIPVFTLVVGTLFVAALAGLLLGIARWKKPGAKIAVIASTLVLLGFALVTVLVLITVWSGSMG
jgi:ABC-type microcin C transport system permease subunit YejB